ncbi:hypothetical protein MXMO3_00906 [Maritalea myrionectae]|uniref:Uncharacterized protein n=1 Tax=Maritalea myrionectae TaxID=454601 RepID=A0A2R4MBM9_9HYPH|nr:hypothetical protein [Maritalea myrionectae]AVX03438.1 hypothetical protein MXMO3_00906 [Maritalea myrionectae]
MSENNFAARDVFTPNDTPTVTYVGRDDLDLESNLKQYCELPKMVVSISGPSKSGKTVLINKVLQEGNIIPVIGSGITSPDEIWTRALGWMETPTSVTTTKASTTTVYGSTKAGGEVGIPLVAKGKGEAVAGASKNWNTGSSETIEDGGLPRVIKEIAHSDFVIFLDDFHYIDETHREEIGRQIKVASDNGVKIITASVPHRTDDVVRSNPELRGRVAAVDVGHWDTRHLRMIARQGFSALNVDLPPQVENVLCDEAIGSPQLMQTICFCLCQVLNVESTLNEHKRLDVTDENIAEALLRTSHFTDFSKMLAALHAGPRTRGQERKEHSLIDGSNGDVYRAALIAMCSDPVRVTFPYDEMMNRIKAACVYDSPVGSSVTSCLEQMQIISENLQPGSPVLVWDGDNLDITDPYFAFFLRSSEKLSKLSTG